MDSTIVRRDTDDFKAASTPWGFSAKEMEDAGLRFVERRFGVKDTIFAPGDFGDQLYFLLSGTVRLYKLYGDYKEATTALLKDSGVFGKLSLDGGSWQDVFAEAMTEVRLAAVQKSAVEEIVKRRPDFALKLFTALSERLQQSDEVIGSLMHREVSARLATLLLNLGQRFGHYGEKGTILDIRLTHRELANMIASTREAVSKVMSELQREKIVEVWNRRIVVRDREALAEQAAGSSGPRYTY